MTILKGSQLGIVAATAGVPNLQASQLGLISISSPPVAASLDASQLGVIIVMGNNKSILPLGPAFKLPCWQPCTAYGTRSIVIRLN